MAVSLIVKAAVKELINKKDMKASSEVIDAALTKAVEQHILKAIERAKANNRKTVLPQDL